LFRAEEEERGREFFHSVYNERAKQFQNRYKVEFVIVSHFCRVTKKEEIKNKVSQMPKFEGVSSESDSEEFEYIEVVEYVEGSFSGSEEEIVIIEEYVEEGIVSYQFEFIFTYIVREW
jgi:hypothetical protein